MNKQLKYIFLINYWVDRQNKNFISSYLLYAISIIFICYMSYQVKKGIVSPVTWNALFWIIQLFSAINVVVRSFVSESRGRQYYYYFTASAEAIVMGKILYNTLLLLLLAFVNFSLYSLVMGNLILDKGLFILILILGSMCFAATLTLISAISAKTNNAGALLAILGFPIIIPVLLMLIKASYNAIDGLGFSASSDEIYVLLALEGIVIALSWILFPYVWNS